MISDKDIRTEITNRKNAEEELRKFTDQLEKIKFALDESSLVAITDKNGTITYANKKFCDVSEYVREELIGQNHRILKSGFHTPEFYVDLWKTISSGHTWHGEIKNVSKHGKYYWVKTTIVPFLDGEGKPEQYIAIRTEITDRKNAEEKLRQLDITKDEFSAMVTHELKTPLVPILGYCKMLKTSMLGKLNEEETNAIEVIEKNTKALEQLITDIMDIRKLDIGKMKFHLENFHVSEPFDDLDSSYKKILKNKGIEFVTKLSVEDISIYTDKARLRQVFDNLIGNSIKFVSENNGLIEVGGYKENNSLILYVKDNGIGIPKDKQSNLFKNFYQIDTSLTRSVGGTGLGLAISKGIMDNLGGSIWVESDGKTGTTLYLKLPL